MNEEWSTFLKNHPEANFLQSPLWAETNRLIGHKILVRVLAGKFYCLMIIKNAKRGRFLEIPGGPLLDWSDKKLLKTVFSEIKSIARENHCVFVRLRPQLPDSEENRTLFRDLGLKPALMHLHAQNTVILDLKKSEDTLLAEMRRQTRYEVRRAEKLGLKVEKSSSENIFAEFHATQTETAARQHFIPPTEKDLLAERTAFGDNAKIYTVKTSENKPVAYGLILNYGLEADYFEAASTDLNRSLPGAYTLLWTAIKDAKVAGLERFNLWGIAPNGAKNHRYSGVTTFKTGFGGEIVDFLPAHDLIINPVKYSLNFLVEKTRKIRRHL